MGWAGQERVGAVWKWGGVVRCGIDLDIAYGVRHDVLLGETDGSLRHLTRTVAWHWQGPRHVARHGIDQERVTTWTIRVTRITEKSRTHRYRQLPSSLLPPPLPPPLLPSSLASPKHPSTVPTAAGISEPFSTGPIRSDLIRSDLGRSDLSRSDTGPPCLTPSHPATIPHLGGEDTPKVWGEGDCEATIAAVELAYATTRGGVGRRGGRWAADSLA